MKPRTILFMYRNPLSWLWLLVFLFAVQLRTCPVFGVDVGGKVVELWPDGAPSAVGAEPEDRPTLRIFLPPSDKATGAGVVICPGGVYVRNDGPQEGVQVAQWFNSIGVAGFVLKYRLTPRYRHPAPLQDAQRTLRYLRFRAADFGLSTNRIGICGFSAGGHLAGTLAAYSDAGKTNSPDPVERYGCRPDFVVTAYPVIIATRGSLWRLVGTNLTDQSLAALSIEKLVSSNFPPAFLFHHGNDVSSVRPNHSLAFYEALNKAGVPTELHIFGQGGHGTGLAVGDPANGAWPSLLHTWLRQRGILTSKPRVSVTARVLIDGQTMESGRLTLIPLDADCPTASTFNFQPGSFVIPAKDGPCVGRHRIEVRQQLFEDSVLYTKLKPSSSDLVCELQPGENPLEVEIHTK